jgi:hypothetical protein
MTTPKAKAAVELGQPVRVKDHGVPWEGTVTKVGRVWIEITRNGSRTGYRFRLDTQTSGSNIGDPPRFYTLDQWAAKEARGEAMRYLQEQGITIEYRSKAWRGRETELAALLRSAATPTTTEETT